MSRLVGNKSLFRLILFIATISIFFSDCQFLNNPEKFEQPVIEIAFQKAFIWYSESIILDWSPKRIYVEAKVISHSNDTTLLLVTDNGFQETSIKSCIVAIINQDTILLSPGLHSSGFVEIWIAPRDTIEYRFSYIGNDYLYKSLKATNKDKAVSKKRTKKNDNKLIIDLLDAPLSFISNKKEYENTTYHWANTSNIVVPKVIFTKAKPFKIFIEDHRTLRCEDCD